MGKKGCICMEYVIFEMNERRKYICKSAMMRGCGD